MHWVHYVEGPSGPPATAGKKAIKGTSVGGKEGGGFFRLLTKLTMLTCAGAIGHLHGAAIVDFVDDKVNEINAKLNGGGSRRGGSRGAKRR